MTHPPEKPTLTLEYPVVNFLQGPYFTFVLLLNYFFDCDKNLETQVDVICLVCQ